MEQTNALLNTIVAGLREKKGRNMIAMDLSGLDGAICRYMVVCEGNSPAQVSALSDSVWDFVRKGMNEKPLSMHGNQAAVWIGMDYGDVLVHIFLPEQRAFYNLDNLWADIPVTRIPDLD
jgi:ribosome-associated protein